VKAAKDAGFAVEVRIYGRARRRRRTRLDVRLRRSWNPHDGCNLFKDQTFRENRRIAAGPHYSGCRRQRCRVLLSNFVRGANCAGIPRDFTNPQGQ